MTNKREDITVDDVVRLWLEEGQSIMAIALLYDTSTLTVRRRLDTARKERPELPWGERKLKKSASDYGSNRQYSQMNDGKAGAPRFVAGSIINGRRNRSR